MSITCICLLYVVICYMSVICYISVICLVLGTSSGSIGSVWISIWDVKLQAGGVVRVRLYVIYAHLCNHILLQSGGGTSGTVLYTVRGVRGLGIRMLTLDTTSLYAEDRGLQVPMALKHGNIVGTQCCDTLSRAS